MEFNKIAGAILLAGVIAMGSGTIAKILFGGYDHHDDHAKRGFQIEVSDDAVAGEVKKEIDRGTFFAAATAEQGKKVAKKCVACHSFEEGGANKVGPNLYGAFGGTKSVHTGYNYSAAFQAMEGKWGYDELWDFLTKPSKYVKGTKMAFAGLKKPEDLASMIIYMRENSPHKLALPAPKIVEADAESAAAAVAE